MAGIAQRVSAGKPQLRAVGDTARDAIGRIEPGMRLVGLTKGQFSQIDILRELIEQAGPAEVVVSTWSVGLREAENVTWLMGQRSITSFLLLVDRSFPVRKSDLAQQVWVRFGPEAIRCAYNHAKFLLVRNARWNLCLRSSMNLNRNPRFEQFDLDDSAEICDFFAAHVAEAFRLLPVQPRAEKCNDHACAGHLAQAMGGSAAAWAPAGYRAEDMSNLLNVLRAPP